MTPRLARPCSRLGALGERDGQPFCDSCGAVVHDLRHATRSEAAALYRANGGQLCGIVRAHPDGELRFRAEPPRRGLVAAAAGASIALSAIGCGSEPVAPTASAPAVAAPPPEPPPSVEPAPDPETSSAAPADEPSEETNLEETSVEADGHDHTHDASADPAHHERHRHRHPVVVSHDDEPLVGGLEGL